MRDTRRQSICVRGEPAYLSQAVNASQARSQASTTTTEKADTGSKVRCTATEANRAIWVRKQMVKVPLIKLKFNLQITRRQGRLPNEDFDVETYQSLFAN